MRSFVLAAALAALAVQPARAADRPPSLAEAVAECRRVVVAEIPEKDRAAKEARVGVAIERLHAAKEDGARAVEAELAKLRAAGETDVFFQATAAEVILDARGAAGTAAALEAFRGVDPARELPYLWTSLVGAAATRDARVLPLLRLVLATDEQSTPASFPAHAMRVPWPLTLEFVYGAFGPEACDDLAAAAASPDARVAASAAWELASLRCPGARALLRPWAEGADEGRAAAALRALGTIGDPRDLPLFLACPDRRETEVRRACAFGVWELSDLRAAPAARRFLGDEDERVRMEGVSATAHLLDAEGAQALVARRGSAEGEERARIDEILRAVSDSSGVDREALGSGDAAAWKKAIAAYWAGRDRHFDRKDGDPKLDRAELARQLARWEQASRVELRDPGASMRAVLAVALAEDLPALFRARGRVLLRQSDECMDEVQWLERIIRVVHRRSVGATKPNE